MKRNFWISFVVAFVLSFVAVSAFADIECEVRNDVIPTLVKSHSEKDARIADLEDRVAVVTMLAVEQSIEKSKLEKRLKKEQAKKVEEGVYRRAINSIKQIVNKL